MPLLWSETHVAAHSSAGSREIKQADSERDRNPSVFPTCPCNRQLCTAGLLFRATLGGEAFDELVHRDADENHATNHRELGLGGNVEEENRVLYHLDHRRAADDASDCSFAAAKAAPAEHRSRNGIQLVKFPNVEG